MSHIRVNDLRKSYRVRKKRPGVTLRREMKVVQALDGIDFDIEVGELVGFIGPNGGAMSPRSA